MKRLLGKNPHLKVLALALTIVLYFFVLAEKETTREFTVALDVGRVPSEHIVMNELPDVIVTVSGSARAFGRLPQDALRTVVIDVSSPDAQRRELRETDFNLPRQLRVESIAPRWIELDVEQLVDRELPIRPVVRGTPARGYEASDPVTTPDRIVVTAPESYFPELDAIFTEGIDITGAAADVVRRVGLSVQRPFVTWPADTRVEVRIAVGTVVETKTLEGVPLLITGPQPERCAPDVDTLTVTVTGPKSLIDALGPTDLFAGVDCDTYVAQGAGLYAHEPHVKNLARGVTVVDIIPTVVRVRVSEATGTSNNADDDTDGDDR